jgi:hypothetical protein
MKVFSVRFLALIFVVAVMSTGTNVYSQSAEAAEAHSPAINKDLVAAKWKIGDTEYTFHKDGTSLVTIDKRECPGTWQLRGKMLIINPKKLMYKKDDPCSRSLALQIINVSANDLHVFDQTKKKEFHLAKQSSKETE